jgi:hypothetical protein
MKSICLAVGLLAITGAAVASDTRSKVIERPEGTLTVNWGPAAPLPNQGRPDFDALDANNDGRLTLQETESHLLLHSDFIYADSNRNGSISRAELERWN